MSRRSARCSPTKRSPPTAAASAATIPVYRRPLKQWMLRITAYADRLLADLDLLDWTDSIKQMQRNWIGRSDGRRGRLRGRGPRGRRSSRCSPPGPTRCSARRTWCSRPSTRSSTRSSPTEWPGARLGDDCREHPARRGRASSARTSGPADAVRRYREFAAQKSELERQAEGKEKTGVFTGAFAINPVNDERDPDLRRRLRADGLRHRRDHGRARARPARLRVRAASSTSPIAPVIQPSPSGSPSTASTADTPATSGPRRSSATASR